jgi:HTH-like domain
VVKLMERYRLSQRHACELVGLDRSTMRYRCRRPEDTAIRERLRELAAERRRFGYRRLGWMLAREGHTINHKKLYRIYREEPSSRRLNWSKQHHPRRVKRPADSTYKWWEIGVQATRACSLYQAGPERAVPGRWGMTYTEEDWVDDEATSRRRPEEPEE